jgi:hypothetical protein
MPSEDDPFPRTSERDDEKKDKKSKGSKSKEKKKPEPAGSGFFSVYLEPFEKDPK